MVRFLSFIFFCIIFSCTIIEDSDITSSKELDNLKFKSIEVNQSTNTGSSTAEIKVTLDDVVNITFPDSTLSPPISRTINRQLWMDWPAFGNNSKLKLKSGVTTSFKSYASFLESGKLWTFYFFDSDTTLFELYRFRYDAQGRLCKISTFIDHPDDGLPPTVQTNDTLIYGNPNNPAALTSIIRNPKNNPVTFALSVGTSSNDPDYYAVNSFDFQGSRYKKACEGGGCGEFYGGNYHTAPASGGQPTGVMNLTNSQKAYLKIQDRNNDLESSGCGGCRTWIDTFYFHPLMILKDDLDLGDTLLFIYMVDWWKPVTTQEMNNNETVTFNFKYDL